MVVLANYRLQHHNLCIPRFQFNPNSPSHPTIPRQGYPFQISDGIEASALSVKRSKSILLKRISVIPRCSSNGDKNESTVPDKKSFGYSRKDVLLIGLGVTAIGVGMKSGLEFFGWDPLQAGNVVQLVMVLGLTVGWISTYMFRVSNKEMTYAQQLRDYESKVMEKRLESLNEAELAALLEQVEEEKQRLPSSEQGEQLKEGDFIQEDTTCLLVYLYDSVYTERELLISPFSATPTSRLMRRGVQPTSRLMFDV